MIYLDGFPSWQVGSGSYITLKNRYLYEWRSYTSQFEEEDGHDMKLTRIDCNTGKVEIVDEFKLNSPLIYLCKIDEFILLMEPRKKSSVKYMKTT